LKAITEKIGLETERLKVINSILSLSLEMEGVGSSEWKIFDMHGLSVSPEIEVRASQASWFLKSGNDGIFGRL